ncbi:amine dehydrogenase large subunit [Achromobacter xylosoxidans]|uniref:amine dehydrogenase large subunit n=1 Tax=Alcaligenes xylosoxydans xylosoxydans TaxID=85698 RepID=UPI00066936B5|nr:amine dehydrogenase large subunit [Achromobacter xylosoxidans]AMH06608.1 amine dehydrogenase [Achromobacter xylosoxidans]MCH1992210.1 amine dehydrogenase [Achromobacter xylosoxidans]MDH0521505.1 amine dehydrogenase [Achromobacter xylosoxidans]MDH0546312.1 amine dehydrogenase [Achromobacter xylosoxidans]NYS16531.1 amine dehydrogenase [Achromobacter xylosoxidans]
MIALCAKGSAGRAGKWALCAALAAAAGLARADLPVEELKGGTRLPPATPHRLYVMDAVFNHLVDSRINIYDGDTMKFLGLVPSSFNGHMTVSADGKDIYIMTTYYERLNRGKRTDVVEAWDAETLTPKYEVPIPEKRAQALNYRNYLQQSSDGGLLFVQNATPASSVTVVDLKTRKFADEVTAAAGCWSIIVPPSRPRSFASICGDGSFVTVDLDAAGKPSGQQRSKPMFEVEKDPIFTHTDRLGDTFYFVSYNGNVYSADFSGAEARFGERWSLLDASGKDRGWRPGGYNLLAVNRASKRLYVGMHPNGAEGSHKTPAAEIWVYDLATHKRLARIPGKNALSMSVSQDDKPRLFTIDGGNVNVYDAAPAAPVFKGTIQGAGETALQVEPQPGGTP